jgi:UDP-3-O-[3-hydroxymyristoyl] glucosamine N-acyltransferase
VTKDIPPRSTVLGAPAVPHIEFKRQLAALARLPELRKALRALEERLAALEARLTD